MKNIQFRKAKIAEINQIWKILQQAIVRRKKDGSNQWQDEYPNLETLQNDIKKNSGFVLTNNDIVIGYSAIFINNEPEYKNIEGNWLTNNDFIVIHRVAISENYLGKGFAKIIFNFAEKYALKHGIYSIKADTNHDNVAMIKIFNKLGYTYCGKVHFRGSPRNAFEKVLIN